MKGLSVIRLLEFTPDIVQQLITVESEAFGLDGALNTWSFPAFIRHGAVYILYSDNHIIGVADIMRDFNESELAFIYNFVIKKDERNKGLAKHFLQELKRQLGQEGVQRIQLTVAPDNHIAISAYEQAGFVTIAELFDEYGTGIDRLLYELRMEENYGR